MHSSHHHVLWGAFVASVIVLLLAAVGAGAITYERAYEHRIFPGVRIGTTDVGGLEHDAAIARIRAVVDARLSQGFTYVLIDTTVTLDATMVASGDPDLSYPIVEVDVPALVQRAFNVGRSPSFTAAWSDRVSGAVNGGIDVPLEATIHHERLMQALEENFQEHLTLMQPPRVVPTVHGDGTITWTVESGTAGRVFHAAGIARDTAARVATLDPAPIVLTMAEAAPPFTVQEAVGALPLLDAALARAPLAYTLADNANAPPTNRETQQRWQADAGTVAQWLRLDATGAPALDRAAFDAWFTAHVAKHVERPARDADLTFDPQTKRVLRFRPSAEGRAVDRVLVAAQTEAALFGATPPVILLTITTTTPTVALADTNDLGIRELLGRGTTSFSGSPANRRHNIRNGSSLLEGRLIAPGATFSTVETVSPFSGENGYKPELVIKGTRTIPEFGGGMCQVSTTLFRAALAAGLPIVERTNHAYRVPYYEPPIGMDATIYGPKPDFRFTNDTGHHILITTRIAGDTLEYEFWGTSDGRTATTTEPEVYNIVNPAATKIVETTDLEPGKEKCIERAHPGADAKFTYTVTYADGRVAEKEFKSHYRAWQAVCLRGVAPSPVSQPMSTPSDAPATPATASASAPPDAPRQDLTPLFVD